MSNAIDTALVQTYRSNIEIQFQQKGSRLRDTVTVESQKSEFDFYDRIGPVDAVEIQSRHSDTPLLETPHSRRRIGLRDFDWADMIDRPDKIRMLADPTSSYTQNAVMSLGRKMDDIIIGAAIGDVITGKTGGTTKNFADDGGSVIANSYVESGTTVTSNLTVGKLRRARYLFDKNEAIDDGDSLTLVVTASQIQALLRTVEATSSDYNTVRALVNGEINSFMGFNFVRTERLTKTANTRHCLAYPSSGITLAVGTDINVDVGPRRDKRNNTQVYVCASFGATRMWGEKVVQINCEEA
jgi:hypothetical protein